MYEWSQDLPFRVIFHDIPFKHLIDKEARKTTGFLGDMAARHKGWMQFAEEQVLTLCNEATNVRHGSWTIYFNSKEDVTRVRIMLVDYVVCAQSLEAFKAQDGKTVFGSTFDRC